MLNLAFPSVLASFFPHCTCMIEMSLKSLDHDIELRVAYYFPCSVRILELIDTFIYVNVDYYGHVAASYIDAASLKHSSLSSIIIIKCSRAHWRDNAYNSLVGFVSEG